MSSERYTMQEFVEKYAKHDVVNYCPEDLVRGDGILVFDNGVWKSALFLEYFTRTEVITAIPDSSTISRQYQCWVVIEG